MPSPVRTVLRILTFFAPRMWYLAGVERRTGKPLSLIWCGPRDQLAYMSRRMFQDGPIEKRCIGRRPVFLMKRVQAKYGCPLGIVAGPRRLLAWMRREEDIEIPWWIDAELNIEAALETSGRPKSLKEDLRRVRNNRLRVRRSTDPESYRDFYDRYYLPTVTGSHASATIPTSFERRWLEISTGQAELLWITRANEPIGGIVISYAASVPALRDIGILDGDRSLRVTGVVTAAYYFAMQRLRRLGHDRVRLGLSRTFLNDGVLTFKQKWRPTLIGTSQESFLIRAHNLCDASRSFLRESSFIGERSGDLHLALIAANDADVRANRPQRDRLSSIYGIDRCAYIDVSGRQPRRRRAS